LEVTQDKGVLGRREGGAERQGDSFPGWDWPLRVGHADPYGMTTKNAGGDEVERDDQRYFGGEDDEIDGDADAEEALGCDDVGGGCGGVAGDEESEADGQGGDDGRTLVKR